MDNITSIYDFQVMDIMGITKTLDQYRGKVLLIVNTASKCGFTKQYAKLQELWQRYEQAGLVILGFPANNFMRQEPGDNAQILNFCQVNYGVSFPMFAKISVRGKDIHPLYAWLTDKKAGHGHGGSIPWNFTKFLISKDGNVIKRFAPKTTPDAPEMIAAIEAALAE